jgi:hypothetical protein
VIINSASIEEHLPAVVDAFFFMKGSSPRLAKSVRDRFLAENAGVRADDFPLVAINLRNREAPFLDG